jgi:tol-pal system beta propeller repeat protein TolB
MIKLLNKTLFMLILTIPMTSYGVKCPIPNCPVGQLCFCPPPPPHYLVLKDKSNSSKQSKMFYNRLKSNINLTGLVKFKKRFKPRSHAVSKPVDQISPWSLIEFSLSKTSSKYIIDISLSKRKTSHSNKKKVFWKSKLSLNISNNSNLLTAADILTNQIFSKILGRKFSAFGTNMVFVHRLKKGRSVIRIGSFNGENSKASNGFPIVSFKRSINKEPRFSNDGKYIVFTSHIRFNPDLYLKKIGRKSIHRISAQRGMNHAAAFSHNSKRLALTLDYKGNPDIYILKTDFKSNKKWRIVKKITRNHGIDTSPAFSPDGKKVAFVSSRRKKAQIYVLDISKKRQRPHLLFSTKHRTYTPRWCKSGKREFIAFTQLVGNRSVIFIYNMKTKKGWRATSLSAPNAENPTWSPNCNLIAYDSNGNRSKKGILVSPIIGGRATPLFSGPYSTPSWGK